VPGRVLEEHVGIGGEAPALQLGEQDPHHLEQRALLRRRQDAEQLGGGLDVPVAHLPAHPLPGVCQLDQRGAAVLGVGPPPDEAVVLHRVDQDGDVARCYPQVVAEPAHDLGSLAAQDVQRTGLRVAHVMLGQARLAPALVRGPEGRERVRKRLFDGMTTRTL